MPAHDYNKKLSLIWDKREKDFVAKGRKGTTNFILTWLVCDVMRWTLEDRKGNVHTDVRDNYYMFNFIEELERRGYDPKTIKFSIELAKPKGDE